MEFNNNRPIYLQIADYICEKIIRREWNKEDRIPSVREFAVSVEVNPNTVMRTFALMQDKGIISTQRGVGYFISENGYKLAKEYMTEQFVKTDLKNVFRTMELLKMEFEDLKELYQSYETNKTEQK